MGPTSLPQCPSLCRAIAHRISVSASEKLNKSMDIRFVILSDPQLGLLENYVEQRPVPYHWDRDLDGVNRAIRLINRLRPKPSFVMVTGDMVHGKPGCSMRQPQTKDILEAFAKLDSNIKLFVLPGNHDLDDSPTSDSLRDYTESWGDDYYSFKMSQTKFLVLNSQYLFDDSKCTQESAEFHRWLDLELETLKREEEQRPIVFQHIPYFTDTAEENDSYFNLPQRNRLSLLSRLYDAGVRYVFAGHLHRNAIKSWVPDKNSDPIHLITTSAVFVQLGPDHPGIRLVRASSSSSVDHAYWSLDELEDLFNKNVQPTYSRS